MFTLTIETDNDAFRGKYECAAMLAHILFEVRGEVMCYHTEGKIRDVNGNTVGRWELTR